MSRTQPRQAVGALQDCGKRRRAEAGRSAATAPAAPAPARENTARPTPTAPAPTAAQPERPPTPAPATTTASQAEQLSAVQKACTMSDFTSHCSWIAPSSAEVLCLRANAAQLSPACQTAVTALPPATAPATATAPAAAEPVARPPAPRPAAAPTRTPQEAVRPAPRPPAAPAPAAAAPRQPTPEQLSAIRSACRSDFMSHCSGVQPGGAEAMQCLERNSAQLSPPCKGAVAAIAAGTPAAASAAATGNAAAPAAASACADAAAPAGSGNSQDCGPAAPINARCAPASRPAVAASLLAWRRTRRACRRNATGRWPRHAGN